MFFDLKSLKLQLPQYEQYGEIIGLYEFITNSHKAINFSKSRGVTELHFLKYKDFIDIIQKFPIEKERYFTMKDEIMIHNKTKYVEVECSLCYSKEHIDTSCTETFYEQRRRQFNLKHGRIPPKKVINVHRKNTQLKYHSFKQHKKIEQEITTYRIIQLYIDQEQEYFLNEHTPIESNQNRQSIQSDEKTKTINIQANVNKNMKMKNREQKTPTTMKSQYNQDQIHDFQTQFNINYLPPSSNSNGGHQEIKLIHPSDQDCNNADAQELNLIKHSFQQLDSPDFKQNHNQNCNIKNHMSPKLCSNYLNKKDYFGSEDEDFELENTSSSVQTVVPASVQFAYEKLDDQKNDMDVRATASSTHQQATPPYLKYYFQKSNSNPMNLTNTEDHNKIISNLAIPNIKQGQFKSSQFTCDDGIIILNKNASNNNKDIININGNSQNNNLKTNHPIINGYFNQNYKNQFNNIKLNNILNSNSQVYASQFQQTLQIQEMKKEVSNISISDRINSKRFTLNMITEKSGYVLEKQRDVEDCVSIEDSVVRNFKIYFPHNNISALTNKKQCYKNRRSMINPFLPKIKFDRKQTIK